MSRKITPPLLPLQLSADFSWRADSRGGFTEGAVLYLHEEGADKDGDDPLID
jgi:hypothetical protein